MEIAFHFFSMREGFLLEYSPRYHLSAHHLWLHNPTRWTWWKKNWPDFPSGWQQSHRFPEDPLRSNPAQHGGGVGGQPCPSCQARMAGETYSASSACLLCSSKSRNSTREQQRQWKARARAPFGKCLSSSSFLQVMRERFQFLLLSLYIESFTCSFFRRERSRLRWLRKLGLGSSIYNIMRRRRERTFQTELKWANVQSCEEQCLIRWGTVS